jgi:pimeloyl-ACP methyl ester carboxylesterase
MELRKVESGGIAERLFQSYHRLAATAVACDTLGGMPTTTLNGFEMYYEDRGEGEPLLLLHGGMGIGSDWRHVFPSDPDGRRVIVPDLRGHGRSTNPAKVFTFRQCASDVLALLDHLQIARAKAIGLSMGAKTLLHMATAQPSRLDAMVLVSATPYFPESLRQAAAQFTPESFNLLSDTEREAMRNRHVHGDEQIRLLYAMTRCFATSYDDMTFTPPLLGTISARTLIVHGDRDPYYPAELAVELFRGIPDSALWIVPYGNHSPIFGEMASTFASTALAHLAGRL